MATQLRDADIWLHDFLQVQSIQVQRAAELRIEKFLQGSEQLSFELPMNDPKFDYLHEDQLVLAENDYWIVDHFEDSHNGPAWRKVVCNARWIELSWRIKLGNYSVLGQTPTQGMTAILSGSGWTVGSTPLDPALYSMEDIDASTLALLRRWAAITGYELQFDNTAKTVSLVTVVGQNRDIGFRWGKNIREIRRKFQPPQATRLYPIGANNLTITEVNPSGQAYIEDYTFYTDMGLTIAQARALYRKDATWVDTRYLLAINLFDAAVIRLAKLAQPRIFYTASVVDITRAMDIDEPPGYEPGDYVPIDDEQLGILESVRVVRTVIYPKEPVKDEVELGFLTNGLLDVSDGGNRDINYADMFVVVDQNEADMTIDATSKNYGEIALTSTGAATAITGSTFVGTATGTGTIEFVMVVDGVAVGKAYSKAFVNGELVEFSWPSFASDVPEGAHQIHWRARVTSGTGTISLLAGHGRSWIMTRGAVGIGINLSPNQFISEEIAYSIIETLPTMSEEVVVSIIDMIFEEELISEAMTAVTLGEPSEAITIGFTSVLGLIWFDDTAEVYVNDDEISRTVPASSGTDDLVLCFLSHKAGASAITGPSGFTMIAQSTVDDGTEELWVEVWSKTDDGTLASDVLTFTASSVNQMSLMLGVIRNTEIGTVSVEDDALDSTTGVDPLEEEEFGSVTAIGNFRMAIAFVACAYDDGISDAVVYEAPAGFELRTVEEAVGNRMMVASRVDVNTTTLSGLTSLHGEATAHAAASIMLLLKAD